MASEAARNVKIRKVETSVAGVSTIRHLSMKGNTTQVVYNAPPPPTFHEPILAAVPLPPPKKMDKNDDGVKQDGEDEEDEDEDEEAVKTRVSKHITVIKYF